MNTMTLNYRGQKYICEKSEKSTDVRHNIRIFLPGTQMATANGLTKGVGLLYAWYGNHPMPSAFPDNKGTVPKIVVMKAFERLFGDVPNRQSMIDEEVKEDAAMTVLPEQQLPIREEESELGGRY